jgi:hypothetical protein
MRAQPANRGALLGSIRITSKKTVIQLKDRPRFGGVCFGRSSATHDDTAGV